MSEELPPLPKVTVGRRFVRWLRRLFAPAPTGPCRYCGELTSQTNMMDPTLFRHHACREKFNDAERVAKEEQKQIDFFRRALEASGVTALPCPAVLVPEDLRLSGYELHRLLRNHPMLIATAADWDQLSTSWRDKYDALALEVTQYMRTAARNAQPGSTHTNVC